MGIYTYIYMAVSWNGGTSKLFISKGFSIINNPFCKISLFDLSISSVVLFHDCHQIVYRALTALFSPLALKLPKGSRPWSIHCTRTLLYGFRLVLGFFFGSGFGLFWFSFLVPFALYLQQFVTRICHFAWYFLGFGMVTLHVAWYLRHVAMFAFHFAWYLWRFGTSTSHLHGICYILVLWPFMWVSCAFL